MSITTAGRHQVSLNSIAPVSHCISSLIIGRRRERRRQKPITTNCLIIIMYVNVYYSVYIAVWQAIAAIV